MLGHGKQHRAINPWIHDNEAWQGRHNLMDPATLTIKMLLPVEKVEWCLDENWFTNSEHTYHQAQGSISIDSLHACNCFHSYIKIFNIHKNPDSQIHC